MIIRNLKYNGYQIEADGDDIVLDGYPKKELRVIPGLIYRMKKDAFKDGAQSNDHLDNYINNHVVEYVEKNFNKSVIIPE